MVGVTLDLQQGAGSAWWPAGASFGADFAGGRFMRLGLHTAQSETIGFARTGSKLAADTDGRLQTFGTDALAVTNRGALIEAAATNQLLHSQGYDQATWQKYAVSVTAGAGAAPDGTNTACRIAPSNASALHRTLNTSASLTGGTAYYLLVYLKADGIRYVYVNADAALGARIGVDLQTGGFVTGGATPSDALVTHLADGWREVRLRGVATGSATNLWLQANSSLSSSDQTWAADGTSGFLAWGAMVSAVKGSYVPTTTTASTRAADGLTLNLPAGTHTLTYTFDDGSTQVVVGASGSYPVPTDLSRPVIRRITATAA